jgi:hypothetical protein
MVDQNKFKIFGGKKSFELKIWKGVWSWNLGPVRP